MSKKIYHAYGLEAALIEVPSMPVIADRAPTASDDNFALGQSWVHASAGNIYFMADSGTWVAAGGAAGTVASLRGDDGASALPTGGGTINIYGTAAQGITTSGAVANTITITVQDATTVVKGVTRHATTAETQTGTATNISVTPDGLNAKLLDCPQYRVPYGNGAASALGYVANLLDGEFVGGVTGAAPAAGSITSTGGTIAITTPAAPDINLEISGAVINQIAVDSGAAISGVAGNVNLQGPTLITGAGVRTRNVGGSPNVGLELYSPYTGGDFAFQETTGGSTRRVTVESTVDAGGSAATFRAQVAGGTSDDAYSEYGVTGGLYYSSGIDNSDGDRYKVTGNNAAVTPSSGTDWLEIDHTGGQLIFHDQIRFESSVANTVDEVKVQSAVQTVGAVTSTLWSYTLLAGEAIQFNADFLGFDSVGGEAGGGRAIGVGTHTGGVAVKVGEDISYSENFSGGAGVIAVDVNGNDIRLRVTGIAATTIDWKATIRYMLI